MLYSIPLSESASVRDFTEQGSHLDQPGSVRAIRRLVRSVSAMGPDSEVSDRANLVRFSASNGRNLRRFN